MTRSDINCQKFSLAPGNDSTGTPVSFSPTKDELKMQSIMNVVAIHSVHAGFSISSTGLQKVFGNQYKQRLANCRNIQLTKNEHRFNIEGEQSFTKTYMPVFKWVKICKEALKQSPELEKNAIERYVKSFVNSKTTTTLSALITLSDGSTFSVDVPHKLRDGYENLLDSQVPLRTVVAKEWFKGQFYLDICNQIPTVQVSIMEEQLAAADFVSPEEEEGYQLFKRYVNDRPTFLEENQGLTKLDMLASCFRSISDLNKIKTTLPSGPIICTVGKAVRASRMKMGLTRRKHFQKLMEPVDYFHKLCLQRFKVNLFRVDGCYVQQASAEDVTWLEDEMLKGTGIMFKIKLTRV